MADYGPTENTPCGVAATALLRGAEQWTRAQCELLSGVELVWAQWAERQRAAFEASAGTLRQMAGCRSLADVAQLQRDWLSEAAKRGTANVGALTSDAVTLSQLAAGLGRNGEARGWAAPLRGAAPAEQHPPEQRQAAE